ncbi:MAG: D-aminoacyl-tRNA deacylase [Planctomycetota bacterium]
MRVLLQRVERASVRVAARTVGEIGRGYVLLVGVGPGDDAGCVQQMAEKVARLRLFPDVAGRFDRSLLDVGGGALVVSQFTLFADTRKGRRPSFTGAAPPEIAAPLVERFAAALRGLGVSPVETGRFGADMRVELVNDGPVTIWLDSDTQ